MDVLHFFTQSLASQTINGQEYPTLRNFFQKRRHPNVVWISLYILRRGGVWLYLYKITSIIEYDLALFFTRVDFSRSEGSVPRPICSTKGDIQEGCDMSSMIIYVALGFFMLGSIFDVSPAILQII